MEKALGLSLCPQVQVHMSRGRPGDSEISSVRVHEMKLGDFLDVGSLELPGKTTLSERGPLQLGTHSCLCWGLSECTQPKPFLQIPLLFKNHPGHGSLEAKWASLLSSCINGRLLSVGRPCVGQRGDQAMAL